MNRHNTINRFVALAAEMMWEDAAKTFQAMAPVSVEDILRDEELEYAVADSLAAPGAHAQMILATVSPVFASAADYRTALITARLHNALESLRKGEEPDIIIPALKDYVVGTAAQMAQLRAFVITGMDLMRERMAILAARYPLMVVNPMANIVMEYGRDADHDASESMASCITLIAVIRLIDDRCGGKHAVELAQHAVREGSWPLWQALFLLPKTTLRGIDQSSLSRDQAAHVQHAIAYDERFKLPAQFK